MGRTRASVLVCTVRRMILEKGLYEENEVNEAEKEEKEQKTHEPDAVMIDGRF
jgi:hypothetical protein